MARTHKPSQPTGYQWQATYLLPDGNGSFSKKTANLNVLRKSQFLSDKSERHMAEIKARELLDSNPALVGANFTGLKKVPVRPMINTQAPSEAEIVAGLAMVIAIAFLFRKA